MKAAARQSLNCIKNQKKYGEVRFSIWRMEFLLPALWHDRCLVFEQITYLHFGVKIQDPPSWILGVQ